MFFFAAVARLILWDRVVEAALGIEHLDLMAIVVGDVDMVLMINTYTSGKVESSIVHTFPSIDDENVAMSRMRETRSLGHGHDGGMRSMEGAWCRQNRKRMRVELWSIRECRAKNGGDITNGELRMRGMRVVIGRGSVIGEG
jgi:hypothetical protein